MNRFKAKSDGESPRRGGVTPFIQVVLRKRAIQSLLLFVPVYLRSLATLTKFANDAGITAASLTAIGAFESATVGWFDFERKAYREIEVGQQCEVLSAIGDVGMVRPLFQSSIVPTSLGSAEHRVQRRGSLISAPLICLVLKIFMSPFLWKSTAV